MKLYLTTEPEHRLRHVFTNLSNFAIVDVAKIIQDIGLDISIDYNAYIVNNEILKILQKYARLRSLHGVIYINENLKPDTIMAIRESLFGYDKSNIEEIILMDNYDVPRLTYLYGEVGEVLFFTCFKRVKIVECKPIIPSEILTEKNEISDEILKD